MGELGLIGVNWGAMKMSEIIKEYCQVTESRVRAIVRRSDYGHSLASLLELYAIAQIDVGGLTPKEIDVVHYGGERYKGTFGIEFELNGKPPEGYKRVDQVEYTL